jgi:hypothetical protein
VRSSIGIALREFKGSNELKGHEQLLFKRGDTVVINLSSFLKEECTPVLDLTQSSSSLADSKDRKLKFLPEHYRPNRKYMHGTIGHRKGWFPVDCVQMQN